MNMKFESFLLRLLFAVLNVPIAGGCHKGQSSTTHETI